MLFRIKRRLRYTLEKLALRTLPPGKIDDLNFDLQWKHASWVLAEALRMTEEALKANEPFFEVMPITKAVVDPIRQLLQGKRRSDFLAVAPGLFSRAIGNGIDRQEWPTVQKAIQNGFFHSKSIETSIGRGRLDYVKDRLTSSTIGHAWMAVKVHEFFEVDAFDEVIELGGGYGNFCRLMMAHNPETSYVIVDLPEVIAIQYLFLKLACPHLRLSLSDGTNYKPARGSITLVPVACARAVSATSGKKSLFTSHFALNESGDQTVNGVLSTKYFNTNHVFVALPREEFYTWGARPSSIFRGLEKTYETVEKVHIHAPKGEGYAARAN